MASINDRWWTKQPNGSKTRSDRHGTGLRWQVRYRNPAGESRNKSFERQVDAERFMVSISVDLHRGNYIDPKSGAIKFEELAIKWLVSRTADSSTLVQNELHVRKHMLPYWSGISAGSIKHSDIQTWISKLQNRGLSPKYIRLIFINFRLILEVAVNDELIQRNPANLAKLQLPAPSKVRVEVWTQTQVSAVIANHPRHLRLMPLLGATCGLRQGEILGLRVHDIDFETLELNVRQQIKLIDTRPTPALPKFKKTRVVPLPGFVAEELARYLESTEALEGERSNLPGVGGIIFSLRERKPINKNYYNTTFWHPAVLSAGLTRSRSNGTHALRHFCASTWLEHGVSIRAVADYLGHSDPGFTLRIYTHLMPNSDAKARQSFEFMN
jgi:integrase